MQTPWGQRYAQRTQRMSSSAIRELLKLTAQKDVISFAGGLPAPDVFPVAEFQAASDRILKTAGPQALQYSTTEGYLPLRELIAAQMAQTQIYLSTDNILITSGSQQALDLIGKIFINPGDHILVEDPTYLGALQAWTAYGAEYIPIPMDEDGMVVDDLEALLRTGPKFIYVLPTFQNPTGVSLSLERRQRLVEIADRYGVPVVEDDPYGQLRYEGTAQPPVIALDHQYRAGSHESYNGNVIYLSTFSKTLAPGMRLAWVSAPQEVIRKLVQAKQGADLHTSTFNQMIAFEVARDGFLERHIEVIRRVYGERRNLMLDVMAEFFPAAATWTRPQGGLFLWAALPDPLRSLDVLDQALARKVAFVPGSVFYACGGGDNTMRINFSNATEEGIRLGIERLGMVIKEQMR